MSQQSRIRLYAVLCVAALLGLAAQEMDFGPTINLQRDIVMLNDGIADKEMLAMLKEFLHRRFGLQVRIEQCPMSFAFAARPWRGQWEAHEMLDLTARRVCGQGRCILLTNKDIFGKQTNWVSGSAIYNGSAIIVSTCRMNPAFWSATPNRDLHHLRVRKTVLHELTHTFGRSQHCENWNCVGHNSNSLDEIDRMGEDYCPTCDAIAQRTIAAFRMEP